MLCPSVYKEGEEEADEENDPDYDPKVRPQLLCDEDGVALKRLPQWSLIRPVLVLNITMWLYVGFFYYYFVPFCTNNLSYYLSRLRRLVKRPLLEDTVDHLLVF